MLALDTGPQPFSPHATAAFPVKSSAKRERCAKEAREMDVSSVWDELFKCKVLKDNVLKPFKPSSFILHSSKHVLDNFYEFWHGQESFESYSKSRWISRNLKSVFCKAPKSRTNKAKESDILPDNSSPREESKESMAKPAYKMELSKMRIHKRLIDLHSPEIVKQITSISNEPGVEVEVTTAYA
ncbi:hypothetical protein E5288_WYG008004 [Bos mutus]|uniref:Small ribosomal subunit protein uS10 domain-containing protein n=1 Tax=Bos mutus TaxID=72004 RepID=A0A6B0R0P0_9CETA|nr:hypothetical protein [Bos mutus]